MGCLLWSDPTWVVRWIQPPSGYCDPFVTHKSLWTFCAGVQLEVGRRLRESPADASEDRPVAAARFGSVCPAEVGRDRRESPCLCV